MGRKDYLAFEGRKEGRAVLVVSEADSNINLCYDIVLCSS